MNKTITKQEIDSLYKKVGIDKNKQVKTVSNTINQGNIRNNLVSSFSTESLIKK